MAKGILGKDIVSGIILHGHSPQNYLNMGWDLTWLNDSTNPVFASVFTGTDVDAYREILRYWERYGTTPEPPDFQRSFPPESYRFNHEDIPQLRLVDLATEAVNTYILQVATVEAQRHLEAGDAMASLPYLEEAVMRIKASSQGNSGLSLRPLSEVKIRQQRWLWKDRILAGAATVTGGKPGVGKSQFMAWLTAKVTRGTLEGDLYGTPRNVLYVYSEDSLEEVVNPRILAADADMTRVFVLESAARPGRNYIPSLTKDIEAIEGLIVRHSIALVIFDPYVASTSGRNRNDGDEVRALLQGLVDTAQMTGCAIHGLMHNRKATADDLLTMLGGSTDWGAIFRGGLALAVDESSGERRTVVSQSKNNSGRMDLEDLYFTIQETTVNQGMTNVGTTRIVWGGASEFSALEVLQNKNTFEAKTKVGECAEWLEEVLAGGEMERKAILFQDKTEHNFGELTIKRASSKVGIRSEVTGFGKDRVAVWSLAEERKAA